MIGIQPGATFHGISHPAVPAISIRSIVGFPDLAPPATESIWLSEAVTCSCGRVVFLVRHPARGG